MTRSEMTSWYAGSYRPLSDSYMDLQSLPRSMHGCKYCRVPSQSPMVASIMHIIVCADYSRDIALSGRFRGGEGGGGGWGSEPPPPPPPPSALELLIAIALTIIICLQKNACTQTQTPPPPLHKKSRSAPGTTIEVTKACASVKNMI